MTRVRVKSKEEGYNIALKSGSEMLMLHSIAEILDGIWTTLEKMQAAALFDAHAADLQQTLSEREDSKLGEITLTNVFAETDGDKQRLGKWLEQLDKCKCPIQIHIEHDDCCEHGEQDEHT